MQPIIYIAVFITTIELIKGGNELRHDSCDNSTVLDGPYSKIDRYGKLVTWANELPILKQQDQSIVAYMRSILYEQEINPLLSGKDVIDHFHHIMALPLQTVCKVGKWVSLKRWLPDCGSTDGERYLCMDNFHIDILNKKCIIYSFGIADDYHFEELMGRLGCFVYAYDPTISVPLSPPQNVYFRKVGLGPFKGKQEMFTGSKRSEPLPITTLEDAISKNGHSGKEITYLKVDIESSEIKAIPEWIQSGVLKHVRQIGIELHTGKVYFDRRGQASAAKMLLNYISQLYDLGFRHVSYSPNTCVGKSQDINRKYYTFLDIVLYKPYTSDQ